MNQQLPIKRIFIRSLEMPVERHKELIRLGWPYAFLILGSSFVSGKIEDTTLNLAYTALLALTGVLAAVSCHRVFLLPADSVRETATVRWSRRETRFLLHMIGLGIFTKLIMAPVAIAAAFIFPGHLFNSDQPNIISIIVMNLVFLPAFYIVSRWSLILPSCATDKIMTPSSSWRTSSSNSFKLFILVGLLPLTTSLIIGSASLLSETSYVLRVVQHSIFLIVMVVEVCLLSLSYEWLIDHLEES